MQYTKYIYNFVIWKFNSTQLL